MKGREKKRKKKRELWKDLLKKKFKGWNPLPKRNPVSSSRKTTA